MPAPWSAIARRPSIGEGFGGRSRRDLIVIGSAVLRRVIVIGGASACAAEVRIVSQPGAASLVSGAAGALSASARARIQRVRAGGIRGLGECPRIGRVRAPGIRRLRAVSRIWRLEAVTRIWRLGARGGIRSLGAAGRI